LNRTIPDPAIPGNAEKWSRIELAKRRLISSLLALGLPVHSRIGEDPEAGLAFDLLAPVNGQTPTTGHADGIITLNIDEADDAVREGLRERLFEPYRTLIGHLRHESGHYYWDRLVQTGPWLDQFRELFGDERRDYDLALEEHYANGAPLDWPATFVSAYASSHPWEDWAESWAHYLHMTDTLDTSASFGLRAELVDLASEPFDESVLQLEQDQRAGDAQEFLGLVNDWVRLAAVMNELSRSMGLADFYPFVLSAKAVAKLHFVHRVITGWREANNSDPAGS
jgi:hypothetical protein